MSPVTSYRANGHWRPHISDWITRAREREVAVLLVEGVEEVEVLLDHRSGLLSEFGDLTVVVRIVFGWLLDGVRKPVDGQFSLPLAL